MTEPTAPPSSNPVLRRILLYGGLLALAVAVVGGLLGWFTGGSRGLVGALLGAAMAFAFLAVTAASILAANRFYGTDAYLTAFFGIVLGGWLLKFLVFLALVFLLKDQSWLEPVALFLALVAAVIGSLVVDVLVVARARIPVVSDLPPSSRVG
ncbi:MAG: hypothetical protein JWR33_2342 [Naasia sp.]|jgi:hypothetical protein|uniref:hypothetical protein n=1 Tax=Naasia sp. TaxID=2546198 RepID=UPI00261D5BD3|nr:hypothetical protein [Naasia sp.]MCU1571601.1 hypothetical protein [Naasia sp.]